MAVRAQYSDIPFDEYYGIILGLTKDIERVALYKEAMIGKPAGNKYMMSNFNKLLKFDWSKYMDIEFPIIIASELKTVKIEGFLNYGKVFLHDVIETEYYYIANPDEIIKILKNL